MHKGEARRAQILAEVAAFLGIPQVQYRRSHLGEHKLQEVTNTNSRRSDFHRTFSHLEEGTMPAFVARCRALVDEVVGDGGHVWGGEDDVAGSEHWSRARDAEHFAQRKLVKEDRKQIERPSPPKTDGDVLLRYANRYTAPERIRAVYELGSAPGEEEEGEAGGAGPPLAGDRTKRLRRAAS